MIPESHALLLAMMSENSEDICQEYDATALTTPLLINVNYENA